MNRLVLSLAVPGLVLAVFVGCPRKREVQDPPVQATTLQNQREAAVQASPSVICRESRKCFHPSIKESKPQSPYYQAGCLEQVQRFEIADTSSIPRSFFTGRATDGTLRPEWTVEAQHPDGDVTFQLIPYAGAQRPIEGVQLYQVKHSGQPVCDKLEDEIIEVDPKNSHGLQGLAIAVPGYWSNGVWQNSPRYFSLSCLTGVVAKCLLWGYVPGEKFKESDLGPYHRACVQAARARYLKTQDDPAFTCQKTQIDVYDRLGIQQQGNDGGFVFESLWGEDGLICMARSRWQGCNAKLQAGNVHPDMGCPDPASPGTAWPDGGLIAVRSWDGNAALSRDGGVRCPTENDARCPGCKFTGDVSP